MRPRGYCSRRSQSFGRWVLMASDRPMPRASAHSSRAAVRSSGSRAVTMGVFPAWMPSFVDFLGMGTGPVSQGVIHQSRPQREAQPPPRP